MRGKHEGDDMGHGLNELSALRQYLKGAAFHRDEDQVKSIAIVCLLARADLEGKSWWTVLGPGPLACAALRDPPLARLRLYQLSLLSFAWDLWSDSGWLSVGMVLRPLDESRVRLVGSLLVALADGIDGLVAWCGIQLEDAD